MKDGSETGKTHDRDPRHWVNDHGDYLFKYAFLHLQDRQNAEDAVQETLLAALQAIGTFSGKSALRTWLTGILKKKIVDHFRKQKRLIPVEDIDTADVLADELFDSKGKWRKSPMNWGGDPLEAVSQRQFRSIFMQCLDRLPGAMRKAFVLKEIDEVPGQNVCQVLKISSTNYWVLMHRARSQLRYCLEVHWIHARKDA